MGDKAKNAQGIYPNIKEKKEVLEGRSTT